MVSCNYSQYSSRYDAFRNGQVLPAFDPAKSGGALMDLNLYNLHFVMGLFGEPKDVKYYPNIERGIDTSGQLVLTYDGMSANLIAAKDCAAPHHFVIEGTDGYIMIQYPPNLIGEVTLHRHSGEEKKYSDGMAMNRLIPEFTYFIRCINEKDHDACMMHLERSLAVSRVQTKARRDAGIIFAADRQ
jgi:predicted dehydrogenase